MRWFCLRSLLGPTDFVLDLTPKIKVKVQDIYVMIRCNAEVIIGLWFHDQEERSCLFQHLKRFVCVCPINDLLNCFCSELLQRMAIVEAVVALRHLYSSCKHKLHQKKPVPLYLLRK